MKTIDITTILGSGGFKDPKTAAWQDDDILRKHALEMISISAKITERIREKDIIIGPDGSLTGDLYFED